MCLTIPGKIISIEKGMALVQNGSRNLQIELGIVVDAKVGDWVLFATNRAVRLIDDQEAKEIIELLEDNYQPVDIAALPLEYKKIIYRVRHSKIQDTRNKKQTSSKSKILNPKQSQNSKLKTQNGVIARKKDPSFLGTGSAIYQKEIATPSDKAEWLAMTDNNDPNLLATSYSLLTKRDLEYLLNLKGANNLEALYSEANVLRKETIKDFVCIHGIVEFSNYCKNSCLYCGIGSKARIQRYRMSKDEIFAAVETAVVSEGYKLVVLQSGEDDFYSDDDLVALIDRIKKNLRVFVFISVGERPKSFYRRAFEAGATGSLFRFETSNPDLYEKMHPGHTFAQRLESLEMQIGLGYYVASGGLIGLPGQTVSDMAQDLLLVQKLGIPMLSSGPWVPSGNAPLGNPNFKTLNPKQTNVSPRKDTAQDTAEDVIAKNEAIYKKEIATPSHNGEWIAMTDEEKLRLTLNYYATARLLMPEIKIPVTTALETLDPQSGRHKALLAGANALMFNITPKKYRDNYNLYDHKYIEREKVWQKYGLFKGEESYEMLEERLMIRL